MDDRDNGWNPSFGLEPQQQQQGRQLPQLRSAVRQLLPPDLVDPGRGPGFDLETGREAPASELGSRRRHGVDPGQLLQVREELEPYRGPEMSSVSELEATGLNAKAL